MIVMMRQRIETLRPTFDTTARAKFGGCKMRNLIMYGGKSTASVLTGGPAGLVSIAKLVR